MKADVAVVIESMAGGGAQQVVASLLSHWVTTGKKVDLITLRGPEVDAYPIPAQVRRVVLGGSGSSRGLAGAVIANLHRLAALRSALSAGAADTVVSFIGTTNILVVLATLGMRQRVVISERNDPRRQRLSPIWAFLRRLTYPRADVVTTNSGAAARALVEMGVARRAICVPNPLREPTSADTATKTRPLMLAVGRLHQQKAYDVLLKAFHRALPALQGWELRILGAGPLEGELRALAEQLDLPVTFLGYVGDPFPHYRAADLFVMPSRYEGSPNALWEAMSCGLPAIISDSMDGALEVVADRDTVWVAKSGDVASLAQAMVDLAGNSEARKRIGGAGQEAMRRFAPSSIFAMWDEVVFGGAAA